MTIDYRALLVKYIRHVGHMEGTTFIDQGSEADSEVAFTSGEWYALEEANGEAFPRVSR